MKKKKYAKSKKSSKDTTPKKTSCCTSQSWMITSIILGVLLVASLILGFTNIISDDSADEKEAEGIFLDQEEAEIKAEEYMNLLGELEGVPLGVSSVVKENNLYKINAEFMGQETIFYMTSDAELLFLQGISLQELNEFKAQMDMMAQQQPTELQAPTYTAEEVNELVSCLADNEFVIYGADWCGFTVQVTQLFGNADISEIYVECTEEEALCAQEGITGYPTIKLGGEPANIARNLASFAEATSCTI